MRTSDATGDPPPHVRTSARLGAQAEGISQPVGSPMQYATLFLGGGPGGTGPLVHAAQHAALDRLLAQRIGVFDRAPHLGRGRIGAYALRSDSLAGAFVECIEAAGAADTLGPLLESEPAREVRAHRNEHYSLTRIGRLIERVGDALEQRIARSRASRFVPHARVVALRLLRGGGVAARIAVRSNGAPSERWIRGRAAVLALGGTQSAALARRVCLGAGLELAAVPRERFMTSDQLLQPRGLHAAAQRLRACRDPRVLVVGGSHSAFSAAHALLEALPDRALSRDAITILTRHAVRVFYPDAAAARADRYSDFTPADLCTSTRRVHRLGGLRGDGRALWRRVTGRASEACETRVRIRALARDWPDCERIEARALRALLERADLVVAAIGYRPRCVPLFDARGRRIELAADRGGALVDASARVQLADGAPLPNVFGIGMASGFVPSGPLGGEPSFRGHTNGVWLYQNGTGELVLRGLAACGGLE